MDKLLKLNLGCGPDRREGYINIDADPKIKPDLIYNLTQKLPYSDNCVSEVILQDVLEHLAKEEGQELLNECGRVLTNNGKITIRVPNISAILKKFKGQDDLVMLYLYGDIAQGETYGSHKYGYTPRLIKETCQKAGLKIDKIQKMDTNLLIEGCKDSFLARRPLARQKDALTTPSIFLLIFKTFFLRISGKEITWKVDKKYPVLLSKIILRPLSKHVSCTYCTGETEKFVKEVLRFSHLKIKGERDSSTRPDRHRDSVGMTKN